MIVVDASAALSGLLNDGPARAVLSAEQIHVPHLVDAEITNTLRRVVLTGQIAAEAAWTGLDTWRHLAMTRHPVFALLDRVWQLRDNCSAYDATYIALAESLGCGVLTADARLGRAPGIRCAVTLVPS